MAIAGCAVGRDLGEGALSLGALAGFGERDGSLEGRAALGRLLRLPPLVAAPRGHGGNEQDGGRDGVVAVALPQLFELLAADFLVDFLEDTGHELSPPQPRLRIPTPR